MRSSIVRVLAAWSLAAGIAGCQTTGGGSEDILSSVDGSTAAVAAAKPPVFGSAKPVVVLPMVAPASDADADRLAKRYDGLSYGDGYRGGSTVDSALQQALTRSNYMTVRLYEMLSKRLPGASVILQPVKLAMAPGAAPVAKPAYYPLNAVVVSSVLTYFDPQTDPAESYHQCTSYATYLCIVASVSTAASAAPANDGVLAVTGDAVGALTGGGGPGAYSGRRIEWSGFIATGGGSAPVLPSLADRLAGWSSHGAGLIEPLPGDNTRFGGLDKTQQFYDFSTDATPPLEPLAEAIEKSVRFAVAADASRDQSLDYVRFYDPGLAERVAAGGPLSADDTRRLTVIGKFAAHELDAMKKRDADLLAALTRDWTPQVEAQLKQEHKAMGAVHADRGMRAFGTMLAGVGAYGAMNSRNSGGAVGGAFTMALGGLLAVSSTGIETVTGRFGQFFSDAIDAQAEHVFAELGADEKIKAASLSSLRLKFKNLYQRRLGSGA